MEILLFPLLLVTVAGLHQPDHFSQAVFGNILSGHKSLKSHYSTAWTRDGKLLQNKDEKLTLVDPETFEEKSYAGSFPGTESSNGKYYYKTKYVRKIYRHSSESLYFIHKADGGSHPSAYPVGPTGNGKEAILLFQWNPNPKSNDFVFVHEYNLYYQANPESPGSAVQLTKNGSELVRYGVADWVYEEDVFSDYKAVWWSPSGRFISYMRFDDRKVNNYILTKYPDGTGYPEYTKIPYPRPGTPNPVTTLYIRDMKTGETKIVSASDDLLAMGRDQLPYVFSNTWLNMSEKGQLDEDGMLTVWANREQTVVSMTLCHESRFGNGISGCHPVLTQPFSMKGMNMWAEPGDFKNIVASPSGFFVLLPHEHSDGNIYNHVAHVEIQKGGEGKITAYHGGAHDVMMITGYSVEDDILTYLAPGEEIGSKQLYKVSKASTNQVETAPISSLIPQCVADAVDVSPEGRTAMISCLGKFNTQQTWMMDIKYPEKRKLVTENADKMSSSTEEVTFETAFLPSGYDVHVAMAKPSNFDPNKKYPVLLDVYGGPNSNRISRGGPSFVACPRCEMIVVQVDGRGSGKRGWRFKSPVYKNLGFYEATDTLDAIKYLSEKYSFIDKSRIAISGFSYGGYLSTYVAALDQGKTIKCAAAGAPVTNWALYDTAYTERYMGLWDSNPGGYNDTNLINKAAQLANVSFLLAHGEADDNVHYQHSAMLSQALQNKKIHFTQLVYTNKAHEQTPHLDMEIERFLRKCFFSQASD